MEDVISAGAAYHNCLGQLLSVLPFAEEHLVRTHSQGIDKLDALLNKLDEAAGDNSLDPLRKALQTKGGARNQARAVAFLLLQLPHLSFS